MKKALIFQGKLIETAAEAFPVSPEMQWVDVADEVTPETHEWDGASAVGIPPAVPVVLGYRELRAKAYPPIGDQLDALWKGGESEAAMLQTVLAVKTKYPKP